MWLWDEHPQRSEWGPDCGIDLVFNDQSGKTWAVQAKCFAPEGSIKKSDMDSFISAASDARFQGRVLVSSTDRMLPPVSSTFLATITMTAWIFLFRSL